MGTLKSVKGKEEPEKEQRKCVAVIASGSTLIIQPNFDISAGSVLTVNPQASGIQFIGGESAAPSEDTTPAA
jgi:hypothetical protein